MSGDQRPEAVLAIDSSTTATKAIVFAADGAVLAEGRSEYVRSSPEPGWQEQDPQDWWRGTCEAIRAVTANPTVRQVDIRAMSITIQRESFVLLDDEDRAIRPAILWLDTRAGEQIRTLGSDYLHHICGKPASTTPSFYKIAWLAENEPDNLARARRVVEVHGYLVHRLTGRWITSWATADPMAIMDMTTWDYHPILLAMAGLRRDQLLDVAPPGSVIGHVTPDVARDLGLPEGLPVVAGAGDGQAAGLGAGVTSADRAYLSLGTSMTMGVHSPTYSTSRAYRTLGSPIAGGYTLEALLSAGALSIAWFRDRVAAFLDAREGHGRLEEMASAVPAGARGVHFLPYLTSAETPHWDADARACFVGLTETDGLPEMYRAVLEGLALEEAHCLTRMEEATGTPVQRVSVLGGAANSRVFTQILADVLERPLDICTQAETTCLGAAVLAAAGVGVGGTHDVAGTAARMSSVARVVEPDPANHEVYGLAKEVHDMLYPSLKGTFGTIRRIREFGLRDS